MVISQCTSDIGGIEVRTDFWSHLVPECEIVGELAGGSMRGFLEFRAFDVAPAAAGR